MVNVVTKWGEFESNSRVVTIGTGLNSVFNVTSDFQGSQLKDVKTGWRDVIYGSSFKSN